MLSLIRVKARLHDTFHSQSSQMCDSNKGVDAKTLGKETGTNIGCEGRGRRESPALPLDQTAGTVLEDLLEQRASGGKRPSKVRDKQAFAVVVHQGASMDQSL